MATTTFSPPRLRLARELQGWTQADLARRLGLSGAAISQFESGSGQPSESTVTEMSEVLEVPIGFLSMPLHDTHEGFFRSLRKTSAARRRRARGLAHVAHDLASADNGGRLPRLDLPQIPLELMAASARIEAAAAEVRHSWTMDRGPVPDVVGQLESCGILVIRLPLGDAGVDAFSLPFADRPVVVLGSDKDDKARSRFDAAHELGHLVVHGDQVWGMPEVERQAHSFAAAFLMPARDIKHELPTRADWPHLFKLKVKWQVSLAALLMRARTLGVMSENHYVSAVKTMSARGWRRTEPVPLGAPEQPQQFASLVEADRRSATSMMPAGVVAQLEAAI